MSEYRTKGPKPQAILTKSGETVRQITAGRVEMMVTKTIVISVDVDGPAIESDPDADYLLRVNGRPVKRMDWHTARRLLGMGEPW